MEQDANKKNNGRKNRKPALIITGAALIWIAAIVFIALNYAFIGGKLISKKAESIDLEGKNIRVSSLTKLPLLKEINLVDSNITIEDYEALRESFPDSHIRWSVPLSSGRYDSESREISISSITEEDLDTFSYLTNLEKVSAQGIPDWQVLSQFENRYPDIGIDWGVELGGKYYASDTSELKLDPGMDPSELREKLCAFSKLRTVSVQGNSLEIDDQLALKEVYPDLDFEWLVNITPEGVSSKSDTLVFSGKRGIDLDLLIRCAPLFDRVGSIDFSGCGYSNADMKRVLDAFPEADVLWKLSVYGKEISSLDEEIDLSGIKVEDTSEIENILPYLRSLKKVIMCDCGIGNEEMDALNKRHDNVKFVWTVHFGIGYALRTDETVFIASLYYGSAQSAKGDLNDNTINPLKYCTDMIAIDIGHQHITDCSIFAEMKDLKWLIIAMNNISDISALANCKELYYLEAFWNPITDVSPLLECKKLRHLNICQCNSQSSLDALAQMTWLERCWMSGGGTYDDRKDTKYVWSDEFLPHTMKRLRGLDHTGDGWRNYPAYFEMRDVFNGQYYPTFWSSNEWRNNPNVVVPEGFIEEHGLDE